MLLGAKCVFQHQDLQMFCLTSSICMRNFHPLEVVGRGSKTQLQVGGNLKYLFLRFKC